MFSGADRGLPNHFSRYASPIHTTPVVSIFVFWTNLHTTPVVSIFVFWTNQSPINCTSNLSDDRSLICMSATASPPSCCRAAAIASWPVRSVPLLSRGDLAGAFSALTRNWEHWPGTSIRVCRDPYRARRSLPRPATLYLLPPPSADCRILGQNRCAPYYASSHLQLCPADEAGSWLAASLSVHVILPWS
jgi:hypothetical protein